MEENLQVQSFGIGSIPSPAAFFSSVESNNVPAVFRGCVKDWKASARWDPANGGLDYLLERMGSCVVEAIASKSAPVFYGDLRSHERVRIPFSTFVGHCKRQLEGNVAATPETLGPSDFSPHEIYLAQVPIMDSEDHARVRLGALEEDIEKLAFLGKKELASINLWMNVARARSSTHYDPHHNVLCVVSGQKQVILWPPSASPFLYPMPIHGEASNHSSVALNNPDYSSYPRAELSMEYSQKVTLFAGDALFIPEGWFHQVDSDDVTIAVNFWWQSNIMCNMRQHMDAYYLRRIMRRLTDKELNMVFKRPKHSNVRQAKDQCYLSPDGGLRKSNQELEACKVRSDGVNLHELHPCALEALQKLVSLVHDGVNEPDQSQSTHSSASNPSAPMTLDLFLLEDDPVAGILWALDACTLQDVLLAMVQNFPRTLEALVLHLLSPVGAEVLTRKFDELDKMSSEEERNKFYRDFYGAFDDQFAAMDAILNGKELFASKAFSNVLEKYLGVNLPKPLIR